MQLGYIWLIERIKFFRDCISYLLAPWAGRAPDHWSGLLLAYLTENGQVSGEERRLTIGLWLRGPSGYALDIWVCPSSNAPTSRTRGYSQDSGHGMRLFRLGLLIKRVMLM